MACVVSFNFSLSSRASEMQSKVSRRGRAACHATPNLSSVANKKSVELTSLNHAIRRVCYLDRLGYCLYMVPPRRLLPGSASFAFIVNQNAQRIISGYWSGPDMEDGWGFVEAFVDQTSY